ncbi:hypothetical protein ACQP4G_09605 [Actinobacillus pleuropneumoniae]|uniref:hypothetical protein n=1 Tax=Actinobacillus pleuropneumoniae TaxID=715 RepID=UPI003D040568
MKDCLDKFNKNLASLSDDKIIEFTRKNIIHGTPFIFASNEDKFYDFRKAIADKWNIIYHEIYITGSAKLGFSFFKNKLFDNDSDIDVAIISNSLFDRIAKEVEDFQWNIRNKNII